jgi:RHS repeat-associated protein
LDSRHSQLLSSPPNYSDRYPIQLQQHDQQVVGGRQYGPTYSGLQYIRARHYNPQTGTFLQADPLPAQEGTPDTNYSYAGNDPVNKVDAEGTAARATVSPIPPSEGHCAISRSERGITLRHHLIDSTTFAGCWVYSSAVQLSWRTCWYVSSKMGLLPPEFGSKWQPRRCKTHKLRLASLPYLGANKSYEKNVTLTVAKTKKSRNPCNTYYQLRHQNMQWRVDRLDRPGTGIWQPFGESDPTKVKPLHAYAHCLVVDR